MSKEHFALIRETLLGAESYCAAHEAHGNVINAANVHKRQLRAAVELLDELERRTSAALNAPLPHQGEPSAKITTWGTVAEELGRLPDSDRQAVIRALAELFGVKR
jgi:hypothetical protein